MNLHSQVPEEAPCLVEVLIRNDRHIKVASVVKLAEVLLRIEAVSSARATNEDDAVGIDLQP